MNLETEIKERGSDGVMPRQAKFVPSSEPASHEGTHYGGLYLVNR